MEYARQKIIILGSTGSIGTQTLKVIDKYSDKFEVIGLSCSSNLRLLQEQANKYGCKNIYCKLEKSHDFERFFDNLENADIVVSAISGFEGARQSIKFLEKTKLMAIANKETIITCYDEFFKKAKDLNVKITPIDSENGSIYQLFRFFGRENIKKITITASGGAFFNRIDTSDVSFSDAVKHPNWNMGKKVTIDSATMFNKGIELIEAKRFFNFNNVEAVIQPQSVIHGLVTLLDNSMSCILSKPDMQLHIANSILDIKDSHNVIEELDLTKLQKLEFFDIKESQFPLFFVAKNIIDLKNSKTICYNACDEACIDLFEKDKISFKKFQEIIANSTTDAENFELTNINDVEKYHNEIYEMIIKKYDI